MITELYPDKISIQKNGCWIWTGFKEGKRGCIYGRVGINKRLWRVHRLSYVISKGKIPSGMNVCHKCDHADCVNPKHLFLGTQADNIADMQSKGRRRSTPQPGESHGQSKLTDDQVREIRRLADEGMLHKSIAPLFRVTRETVSRIARRASWKHI